MKKILLIIILSFISLSSFAIDQYKEKTELYVWAPSGLNMRETPGIQSAKIQLIPFGGQVIMLEDKNETGDHEIFDRHLKFTETEYSDAGIKLMGKWAKVSYKGTEGYIFDGYLGRMKPQREGKAIDVLACLRYNYLISQTLKKKEKGEDSSSEKLVFKTGIFYSGQYYVGGGEYKIVFPDLSLQEAYLFMSQLHPTMLELYQEDQQTIIIDNELEGITIKAYEGTVIITSAWGC